MAPWPAFEDGANLPSSLFLQVGFSIIQLRFLIGISKMLGLIVAPIQYVQPHMRRYSPDLRVVRASTIFSTARSMANGRSVAPCHLPQPIFAGFQFGSMHARPFIFSERGMASCEVDDRERQVLNQEQTLLFKVADRVGNLNLDGVDEDSVASNGEAPIH
jgi:hypothetical protein